MWLEPGLAWLVIIGGVAVYELQALLRDRPTLSDWFRHMRKGRWWLSLLAGGLLVLLAVHLFWPRRVPPPPPPDPPEYHWCEDIDC